MRSLGARALAAVLPPLTLLALLSPASAAEADTTTRTVDGRELTATPIGTPTARTSGSKSALTESVETDESLLRRKDSTPIPVVIKLDYEPVASYDGGVPGLAATSPAVTGKSLSGSKAERRYRQHAAAVEKSIEADLEDAVPSAKIGRRLRTVYGGVAATVPANSVRDLLEVPGVVAVQKDALRQTTTDSSTTFIRANEVYPRLGGSSDAGRGIIVGVIDTGAWPEHPSFTDLGSLSAPPPRSDAQPRTCDFGDNPLTEAEDPFTCNNKLIGGAAFLSTYKTIIGGETYDSARDSDGHGTHTATTAAGVALDSATVVGVERAPLQGVAPGAWVSVYKALGAGGGFSSDIVAAIGKAIEDGVDVLNFSVSGGEDPFQDPIEMAFLDAYQAGVFVAASAGNSGPDAGTVNHVAPWVTTVGATTQRREFTSTLTLRSGTAQATFAGASITQGLDVKSPIVLASDFPGYAGGVRCSQPAQSDQFLGMVVACQRGGSTRVEKGTNVAAGGAVAMVLYDTSEDTLQTDSHVLPTIHIADGLRLRSFLLTHSATTATFTAGAATDGRGDVMADFSSRGPGGPTIKPDVSGPGVQILAGTTPTPDDTSNGTTDELFQTMSGTSMAAPHVAGSAALLRQLHPTWTPAEISSALVMTGRPEVLKSNGSTRADALDTGGGRIDVLRASLAALTVNETTERMALLAGDPAGAVHLNVPSINAPVLPGSLTTNRTVRNATTSTQEYALSVLQPSGSTIAVSPTRFTLTAGASRTIKVTITSTTKRPQQFGEIRLNPSGAGLPTMHMPVAFVPQQGGVTLYSTCSPTTIKLGRTSLCTITSRNTTDKTTTANFRTSLDRELRIYSAPGATRTSSYSAVWENKTLAGAKPGQLTLNPSNDNSFGFIPLSLFDVNPIPIGDDESATFSVPRFVYHSKAYTSVTVDSNGYLVVGDPGDAVSVCCDLSSLPDPAGPNNVLAPFWTDLDGTDRDGLRLANVTDGVDSWLVVEWDVAVWGTDSARRFQVWIGQGASQDISFAYDAGNLPADPGRAFLVGAENADGTVGAQLAEGQLPTQDLKVVSSAPVAGGTYQYKVRVKARYTGTGVVTSTVRTPAVAGTTIVSRQVKVTR